MYICSPRLPGARPAPRLPKSTPTYDTKFGGIYFISRVKENMVLQTLASKRFDADNEVNVGVISDELVGPSSAGVTMRRTAYRDPATQEYYEFVTSEMTLAPGLIAQLYRMRWDIEKVYDEVKNRLHETKPASRARTWNGISFCGSCR